MSEGPVDRSTLFALYKHCLRDYIEETFGWNEAYQRARFDTQYEDATLSLVWRGAELAGVLALRDEMQSLHVSLLLLWPAYRRDGIGRHVMRKVLEQGARESRPVTLSCFLRNTAALEFYRSLDFAVDSTDEHFANLRYEGPASPVA